MKWIQNCHERAERCALHLFHLSSYHPRSSETSFFMRKSFLHHPRSERVLVGSRIRSPSVVFNCARVVFAFIYHGNECVSLGCRTVFSASSLSSRDCARINPLARHARGWSRLAKLTGRAPGAPTLGSATLYSFYPGAHPRSSTER